MRRCWTLLLLVVVGTVQAWPANFQALKVAPAATWTQPVSIEFVPDGRILIGERRGRIWVLEPDPQGSDPRVAYIKRATPFLNIESSVLNHWDRGMLDFELDPNFASNGYVYVAYVVETNPGSPDQQWNAYSRIERFTVSASDPNVLDLATRITLVGETWPTGPTTAHTSHTSGTLVFGDDGTLLYTHGDGAHYDGTDAGGRDPDQFLPGRSTSDEDVGAFRSQYMSSLSGKLIRIDPATGDGIPSNPWYNAAQPRSDSSRIWALGLRNPFRMNILRGSGSTDPAAGNPGRLFIPDVGYERWEEVNSCWGGENFGWPCYEGTGGLSSYQGANPTHSDCPPGAGTLTTPILEWPHSGVSGSSAPFPGITGNAATGAAWHYQFNYPDPYRLGLFFCDYTASWIRFANFDSNGNATGYQTMQAGAGQPVDLKVEPNSGDLFYVAYQTQDIWRLVYNGQTGYGTPPSTPTGIAGQAASGQVSLTWLPNPELDMGGYNVFRADAVGGPWTQLNVALLSSANFADTGTIGGLNNGQLYYYTVQAVDMEEPPRLSALSTAVAIIPSAKWWQWYLPVAGPTLDLPQLPAPFPRVVTIPSLGSGNFDHWNTNDRAPQIRRVPPTGDWTLTSRFSLDSYIVNRNWHTGLMVQFGTYDLFLFGPYRGTNLRLERSGFANLASYNQAATEIELRVVKTGTLYSFEYRALPGNPWTVVTTQNVANPVAYVGALTKTWESAAPLTLSYEHLALNELFPIAVSDADVVFGPTPLEVAFSSAGSYDPDGDILTRQWDFGDGASSSAAHPTHSYALPGQYEVLLTVRDNSGLESVAAPIAIEAQGNHLPTLAIAAPADGYEYIDASQPVQLSALAGDLEDGAGGLSYDWSIDLIHGGVRTPAYLDPPSLASAEFVPGTLDDGQGIALDVICQVTDSGGLSVSDTVRIYDRVLPPLAVLDLRAAQANGSGAYAAGSATSPWVDLGGDDDAALLGFDLPSTASGWQGDGSYGDPYRLELDGIDDRAAIAAGAVAPLLGASAHSCELWLRSGDDVTTRQYVLEWVEAFAPPFDGMTLAIANGKLQLYLDGWVDLANIGRERWIHVVLAKTATEWSAWVDGALAGSGSGAHLGDPLSEIVLGAGTFAGAGLHAEFFAGALGELRVYDFALTSANVAVLHAAGAATFVDAPQPLTLSPASATNGGMFSGATVTGLDFDAGVQVLLSRSGELDRLASNVVVTSPEQLSFDVDLTAAALGAWDLELSNPDGLGGSLAAALDIQEPSPLFLSLSAAAADGGNPPSTPGNASPWLDAAGGASAVLHNFAGDAQSGWQGSGSGQNPYRLRFDGVDDRVTIAAGSIADLNPPSALTVELWFWSGDDVDAPQTLLEWTDSVTAPFGGVSLVQQNGQLFLRFADEFELETLGYTSAHLINYVALTYDGTQVRGFRFGMQSFARAGTAGAQLSELVLGASTRLGAGNYSEHFAGDIAVVRLQRKALSEPQLQAIYSSEVTQYMPTPEATLSVVPSSIELGLGASVDLDIFYDHGSLAQPLRALDLSLQFDSTAFDFVSASEGEFLDAQGNAFFAAQPSLGAVGLDQSLLGLGSGAVGSGRLASVRLAVKPGAPEGIHPITLTATSVVDNANPPQELPRTILSTAARVDFTPPGPVALDAAITPTAGELSVTWPTPSSDYVGAHVFWRAWDAASPYGYPEYDDASAAPSWPANLIAARDPANGWSETVLSDAATGLTLSHAARTVLSVLVLPVDAAGNLGDFASASRLRRANYPLADLGSLDALGNFTPNFDGRVDPVGDLPVLSIVYGAADGTPHWLAHCDIGPTADGTPASEPLTDDVIDFEDLMIFAQDFPSAAAKPLSVSLGAPAEGNLVLGASEPVEVPSGSQARHVEVTLHLAGNSSGVQGLNLELTFESDRLRYLTARRSAALARAGGAVVHFVRAGASSVGLDLAVLGRGALLRGDGELVTLRFELLSALGGTLSVASAQARDAHNLAQTIDASGVAKDQLAALPSVVALQPNAPNPFNPRTTIRFELPQRSDASLRIYDLSGRLVRTLLEGKLPAGYHSAIWQGEDDRGRNVASGVYLYELRAAGQRLVKKMMLVQ